MTLGNTVLQVFCCYYSWCLISLVSVLNLLYFYISTFRSMCAVPNMAVFWSSLTSYFPGMLLTYFLNDFEIVPVAPVIIIIIIINVPQMLTLVKKGEVHPITCHECTEGEYR